VTASAADPVWSRVDVDRAPARETAQGQAAIVSQLDGERAWRAHPDEDRRARYSRLLDELEGESATHAEDLTVQR